MSIIRVCTLKKQNSRKICTHIMAIKETLDLCGAERIMSRCVAFGFEAPFIIELSDTGEIIDCNNSGYDFTSGDWTGVAGRKNIEIWK